MSDITFTPVSELPRTMRGGDSGRAGQVLRDFLASGEPHAVVNVGEGRKMESVQGNLASVAKGHRLPVKVQVINKELFLINLKDDPDEAERYWTKTRAPRKASANGEDA